VQDYSIKSEIVIAHVRKANRGRICLKNTHPFARELWSQTWSFAHNGQLRGTKQRPLERFLPVGTTDSEHALLLAAGPGGRSFPSARAGNRRCGRYSRSFAPTSPGAGYSMS